MDGCRLLLWQDLARALPLSLADHGAGEGNGGRTPSHTLNKQTCDSTSMRVNEVSEGSDQLGMWRVYSWKQQKQQQQLARLLGLSTVPRS